MAPQQPTEDAALLLLEGGLGEDGRMASFTLAADAVGGVFGWDSAIKRRRAGRVFAAART